MSQIFCIRREMVIGMAVLFRSGDKITLFDLSLQSVDGASDFSEELNRLIEKHAVNTVWVNKPDDGEGDVKELAEFRELKEGVKLREMKRTIKPVSGRIAREQLLKKGNLDESPYEQSAKLDARIRKLTERSEPPADIQAYLSGLELVKEYLSDLEPEDGSALGSHSSYIPYGETGTNGMSSTADALRGFL